MTSIIDLKKRAMAEFDAVKEAVSSNRVQSYQDDRLWMLDKDKSGNGVARIRFLPNAEGDETNMAAIPAARVWTHAFRATGGWYIENSLLTINEADPVDEYSKYLKRQDNVEDDYAKLFYRSTRYVSNIWVYEDTVHPDNNGKHLLWKFPKTIYEMIENQIDPKEIALLEKREPVNVFNFWLGADFMAVRTMEGKRTDYKSHSKFQDPSQIDLIGASANVKFDEEANDEAIADLYGRLYPLSEFVDPSSRHFKSYDKLLDRLQTVLNEDLGFLARNRATTVTVQNNKPDTVIARLQRGETLPDEPTAPTSAITQAITPTVVENAPAPVADADENEAMAYFRDLANKSKNKAM